MQPSAFGRREISTEARQYTPTVHVFHAQHDISSFVLKRPVKGHDIRTVAVVAYLQLPQNLLADLFFGIDSNNLVSSEHPFSSLYSPISRWL